MQLSGITKILGGEKVVHCKIKNQMDLIELCKKGLSKDALVHLAKNINLSMKDMTKILPITERTIQRHSKNQYFNKTVSEHILQIAEVVTRGTEVFGDKKLFLKWLKSTNKSLAFKTPISLLDSSYGYTLIMDELGRIEHGVYA